MKTAIVLGPAHPYRGGIATFNERMAEELRQMGYETQLITFTLQYPDFLFPGKTQYSTEAYQGTVPVTRRLSSVNPFNWLQLARSIRRQAPDLLIFKYWMPFMAPAFGTVARLVKKNGKTKVLTVVDNMIPHERHFYDSLFTRYLAGSVDGYLAMSKSVMNDIVLFDEKRPKVLSPHPIYDNFGQAVPKQEARELLGLEPGFKYILFFGFIRDYKGLDILLKAMAHPQIGERKIRLLVAGEFYTDSKPYFDLIEKAGISDRVIMSNDFIPDSKVCLYFSACDVVVQPYKSATQSGVTQIAYHFDKPMIITDVGGLGEFVPDGVAGYVVEPDPDAVAGAILRFYDSGREAEFSENIREIKKQYSWEYFMQNLTGLASPAGKPD